MEPKYRKKNGQISAEFLIILAIVLIVALVAVGLSSFFLQSSGDVVQSETDTYWATQVRPLRVDQMQGYYYSGAPSSGEIAIVIQNVDSKPLTLRNIVLDAYPVGSDTFGVYTQHSSDGSTNGGSVGTAGPSVAYGSQFNYTLKPSEKVAFYLRLAYACADSDPTGGSNNLFLKNLTLYYDTPYFTQLSFRGIKPIRGRCNPV